MKSMKGQFTVFISREVSSFSKISEKFLLTEFFGRKWIKDIKVKQNGNDWFVCQKWSFRKCFLPGMFVLPS